MQPQNRDLTVGIITVCALMLAVVLATLVTVLSLPAKAAPAAKGAYSGPGLPPAKRPKLPSGMSRTVLSESAPQLDLVRGFLSPDEAAHLIRIAAPKFQRSNVVTAESSHAVAPARTSSTAFLPRWGDAVVEAIIKRAARVTGIPESCFEVLQVVRYQPGQYYRAHHDYLPDDSEDVKGRSQRTATLFAYLNELPPGETGGGTAFPTLGITVRPEMGAAAVWHNLSPQGDLEPRTLHSGEPLVSATKYGLNVWARLQPQRD